MSNSQYTAFNLFGLGLAYSVATLGMVFWVGHDFSYGIFFKEWADTIQPITKGIAFTVSYELKVLTGLAIGIAALAALLNPFSSSTRYGDAKWASKRDLKKMGLLAKKGMILGLWKGQYLRTEDYLSVIFLAPPDSRKSTGLIMPNLYSCGDSMMVYDVKFDLFNETSKRRAEFSKVLRFSPATDDSVRFNPLSKQVIGEYWDDIVGDVERLATIIYPLQKGQDSHWVNGARIAFVFFALIDIHDKGETSIPTVRSNALKTASFILEDDSGKEVIAEGTKGWIASFLDENENDLPEQILLRGNDLLGRPVKELGSIFSTFSTGLDGFADSRCSRAFSACDFSPETLRKERTTVYICVSDKDSRRFATPIRILLETFNSHFLSTKPASSELGITNLLDEFPRLGRMDVIVDAPALQRSNRVRTIFCAQAESQVSEIYGKEKLQTLQNSCAFTIYSAQNDTQLNKKIAEACGQHTVIKPSESRSGGKTTKSKSNEKMPLILPQEVGALPVGEIIIHRQGFLDRPIRARLALFYEHKQMKKMIGSIEKILE